MSRSARHLLHFSGSGAGWPPKVVVAGECYHCRPAAGSGVVRDPVHPFHSSKFPKAVRPLSDTATTSPTTFQAESSQPMGTFDDEGNYTPREVVSDDLGMSFADAIDGTM